MLGASEPVAAAGLLGSEDRESQHWTQAEYGESIYTVCCFDEVSTAVPNVRAGEAYFERFARLVWSLMPSRAGRADHLVPPVHIRFIKWCWERVGAMVE